MDQENKIFDWLDFNSRGIVLARRQKLDSCLLDGVDSEEVI